MLPLQEISDRLEIQHLLARYSHAIDRRDWDGLDPLFTEDAVIDYTQMGGIRGPLAEQKDFLRRTMHAFAGFQHLTATSLVELDGDTATARTICFNPMVVDEQHVFFCGLWYVDALVRTAEGWRIAERREERSWFHNLARPPSAGATPPAP